MMIVLLLVATIPLLVQANDEKLVKEQVFSFPPNNTPVSKVVLFGQPLYIRQPFVVPQREVVQSSGLVGGTSSSAQRTAIRRFRQAGNNYPLPQCYTNDSGFMCCNRKLEELMKDTFKNIKNARKNFHTCNVQSIANNMQKTLEDAFKTEFEVISGIGDFASKAHFFADLICKIEIDNRFIQAYATPNRHAKGDAPINTPYKS